MKYVLRPLPALLAQVGAPSMNVLTNRSAEPAPMSQGSFKTLLGVHEGVLDERKDEGVGQWTQTLLARDVLDGWSGLRP